MKEAPGDREGPQQRLHHYRLLRRLGIGGMAEIFLAVDEKTGRRVALKKILPQVASNPDFLDRFFHEIRIQISLKHKNIVELLDCNPGASQAYIVMEYVDGGELHALRQTIGRFPFEIALHVADEALKGLGAAHRKGVIHRDIKPQNIMWTRDGGVKIADFGISHAAHLTRLTMTGTVIGTPAHMSPEQARGEDLDPRTDLFSMGTALYELLTGFNPFTADSIAATLRRVAEVEPEMPSFLDPAIPPSVDVFLRKLHAKDRRNRFRSAEEACEAIHALYEKEGIQGAGATFVDLVADPPGFMAARRTRLAAESAADAERLLKDRRAPPEQALWAAYRTVACAPDDRAAQALFKTAAQRAGQRERPLDNAKIRELEEALRKDPDNLALLLQLAKLYRLEHDFVNLMRFFRKLQAIASPDPYTQGQIAALLGSSPKEGLHPVLAPGAGRRGALPAAAAAPAQRASRGAGAFVVIGGAIVLAGLGIVLWPHLPLLPEGGRAPARLKRLEPAAPNEAPTPADEALQKALEKGALIEKQEGGEKALAHYERVLAVTGRPPHREALLLTMADTAVRAGNREAALRAVDKVIALGGPAATRALVKKAEILEALHDDTGAAALWEQLARSADPEASSKATLELALAADHGQDAVRALTLYEELLARFPSSREANAARLGAAALYRDAGRKADARSMYEEVKRQSPAESDFARSADAGLKSLD